MVKIDIKRRYCQSNSISIKGLSFVFLGFGLSVLDVSP